MLRGCSNYAPRMLHRCSATLSRFLVEQQMEFLRIVYSTILHHSSKFHAIPPSRTAHFSVVSVTNTPFGHSVC